jgi:mannan endo-1,4-beta-mannosidase
VYPHWKQPWSSLRHELAICKSARKPFVVYEYGWDRTNFRTRPSFARFLTTLQKNPLVAGDAFWALQAHTNGHGWMPIPADTSVDPARVETGQWWALYYTGLRTRVNTAADMAARAQMIRAHNYAMSGRRLPPHARPPRPTITSTSGRLYWQGSAGAVNYSIQRASSASGPWRTVCNRCVTDASNGYPLLRSGWYRVIPYNVDGKPGPPSKPKA